ncbi:MAG: FAD-dependent monooxygenase [Bauldia sp.]|nr:FAD-dependent monooxygenase [Bauldia sp.]
MPAPLDAIVVGAGPAGLSAALTVAGLGRSIALLAPDRPADERTTALLAGSEALFRRLGVWQDILAASAPLRQIRIVDASTGLIRAPEALFRAEEIGLDAFGYNLPNRQLGAILDRAVAATAIRRLDDKATGFTAGETGAKVETAASGALVAPLIVAADGRFSPARAAAGIETREWRYDQSALVVNFRHTRDHEDTSNEFHTRHGPFTTVPLGERRSSLVWVTRPREADRLRKLPDAVLADEMERMSDGILGAIELAGARQVFPLSGMTATPLAARRTVLVGESGHVLPPIGAQGLNLGLRDVAALPEIFDGDDPGAPAMMERYDRLRRADVQNRTTFVDALNGSLLGGSLVGQIARAGGLALVERVGFLRRALMREGLAAV